MKTGISQEMPVFFVTDVLALDASVEVYAGRFHVGNQPEIAGDGIKKQGAAKAAPHFSPHAIVKPIDQPIHHTGR